MLDSQIFRTALLLLSLTPLTSCALYTDTKYTEFRGDSDFYGDGGTVRTVDGIDIWETGAPNRPFRVIGRIEQTHRNDGGITSQIAGSQLDKTLIDEAIAKGADALIAIDADSRISGFNTNASASASGGFAYGSSQTTISARDRRVFAVIVYLDRSA